MRIGKVKTVLCISTAIVMALMISTSAQAGNKSVTTLVSVNSSGVKGDSGSFNPAVSSDGRYVAFVSTAENFAGLTGGIYNIFLRDTVAKTTERVSVASSPGAIPNGGCGSISMSSDGRYVAFYSTATNLVAGAITTGYGDIYVRDRVAGTTELISTADGTTGGNWVSEFPSISGDGRYVAFFSVAKNLVGGTTDDIHREQIFIKDRLTGNIQRVIGYDGTDANSESRFPAISADGRYVAFISYATNLVPGDTNGNWDTFVYDRLTGSVTLASVSSSGAQGNGSSNDLPSISADGRFVAFTSGASNLAPGDTNGQSDIFVRDMVAGVTEIVSINAAGKPGNNGSQRPAISADGRFVAFESFSSNLVAPKVYGNINVYYRDRTSGTTNLVVSANNGSSLPSISGNGLKIAFESYSTNIVPADTDGLSDIFLNSR